MTIKKKSAIIYCESQYGRLDGKTAAGLMRHSDRYTIVGVIDSTLAGKDSGVELGEVKNGIPIFADLKDALLTLPETPDCYIYGKAPLNPLLSENERYLIIEAMEKGMDIINGLHQFFSDDQEFARIAHKENVKIKDFRKPPHLRDLHFFTGEISKVTVPVIAVLGTDCAVGKMTTAIELNNHFNNIGIKSVLIATGQTSMMQGAMYGVSIDALVSQFVIGEIENSILSAVEHEDPDIILIEGQGAVGHPAFMSSLGILKGGMPDGIILQHPPARKFRCDFPQLPMPTIESEINLIEAISDAKVMAITLSHEDMIEKDVMKVIMDYEVRLEIPSTDVLLYGCKKLAQTLSENFPNLSRQAPLKNIYKGPELVSSL
jgi:uncharacterized NAD-dependent epimerase/dehydratase family protein